LKRTCIHALFLLFNICLITYLFAGGEIEEAISTAVKEAEDRGIRGKEVTPFILNRVIH
jgi:pseudouridine-5'-phosphate glycosidase